MTVRMKVGLVVTVLAIAALATGAASANRASSGASDYVIGFQAPLSGTLSYLGAGQLAGTKTYFNMVNAQGGISGHKIVLKSADDQANVATAVTVFRDLVRQGAMVVTGNGLSTTTEAIFPAAQQLGVPVMGYGVTTAPLLKPPSPFAYGTGSSADVYVGMMAKYVKLTQKARGLTKPRVAVVTVNSAASQEVRNRVQGASAYMNWDVVASQIVPLTATDASAQVAAIAAGKPDYVFVYLTPPLLPLFANAVKANRLNTAATPLIGASFTNDENVIGSLGLPNFYYDQYQLWPTNKHEPAAAKLRTLVKKYGSLSDLNQLHFVDGWIEAALITAALRKCGGSCNASKVATALNTASIKTADGLAGPAVSFRANDHQAYTYHRIVRYNQAKGYTVPVTKWLNWRYLVIPYTK
jgi:branched-chain amino acid transport system substrate-binding protein